MMRGLKTAGRWMVAASAVGVLAGASAQGIPLGMRPLPNGEQKPSAAIPATAPTAQAAPFTPPAGATILPQASTVISTTKRARVQYQDRLLTVTADNSSLNQILREVARVTGMKITGGVNDDRVFGTYGPAEMQSVLGTLLEGTGSNMLLMESAEHVPLELVLTPRQGGPTPPSPMSGRDEPEPNLDLPPQLRPHVDRNLEIRPPAEVVSPGQSIQPAPLAAPAPAQPPAATTTTDQSPNGVKTPQQIYEQLMQMQQQQQKKPQ